MNTTGFPRRSAESQRFMGPVRQKEMRQIECKMEKYGSGDYCLIGRRIFYSFVLLEYDGDRDEPKQSASWLD